MYGEWEGWPIIALTVATLQQLGHRSVSVTLPRDHVLNKAAFCRRNLPRTSKTQVEVWGKKVGLIGFGASIR